MSTIKTALMLGDVCASGGIRAIYFQLPAIKTTHNPEIVIANGENSADGYGISEESAKNLLKAGVDVITSGNHIFDSGKSDKLLETEPNILRPANFPQGNPGTGDKIFTSTSGIKIAVINLHTPSGYSYTENLYTTAEKLINKIRKETNIIFIDLHGEYSHQKEAFAFEFDGLVTAVCGTHTHVQTMDEKILPKGTGYITDLGMCGVQDSVIGGDSQKSVERARSGVSSYIPPAENGKEEIKGAIISFDKESGLCVKIERI